MCQLLTLKDEFSEFLTVYSNILLLVSILNSLFFLERVTILMNFRKTCNHMQDEEQSVWVCEMLEAPALI